MTKGIIYVMSTVVPGLIKIGKTGLNNFDSRMYTLERNGYSNVVGLKRKFAIAVEDYSDKEMLLSDIFSKSRVPNTELYAIDIDLVIQLLSSFDGEQIYPEYKSKEQTFDEATKERQVKLDWVQIPNGEYYLSENRMNFGQINATMRVQDGVFTVLRGSDCAPESEGWMPESRRAAQIENNKLMENVDCNSPSTAGWIVLGKANNGWMVWKNSVGEPIDVYRNRQDI